MMIQTQQCSLPAGQNPLDITSMGLFAWSQDFCKSDGGVYINQIVSDGHGRQVEVECTDGKKCSADSNNWQPADDTHMVLFDHVVEECDFPHSVNDMTARDLSEFGTAYCQNTAGVPITYNLEKDHEERLGVVCLDLQITKWNITRECETKVDDNALAALIMTNEIDNAECPFPDGLTVDTIDFEKLAAFTSEYCGDSTPFSLKFNDDGYNKIAVECVKGFKIVKSCSSESKQQFVVLNKFSDLNECPFPKGQSVQTIDYQGLEDFGLSWCEKGTFPVTSEFVFNSKKEVDVSCIDTTFQAVRRCHSEGSLHLIH